MVPLELFRSFHVDLPFGVGAEAAEEELPVDDRRSVSVFVPVSPSVSISGVRGSESTDGVGSDECSSEGRDTSDAYE